MKSLTAIALLFFLLLTPDVAGQTAKDAPTIDAIIEKKMKDGGIVGVGAAIIVDKEVVWTKGFGYSDRENLKPFTPDTIMNIGSIAKTFTGVCMLKAVEENRLSLDEDINKYLPFKVVNPHFPDEKITLRHIATHTSSLADRSSIYEKTYNYEGDPKEKLGDFLKDYFDPSGKYYSKENFLNKKPGTFRDYSNIAAGLAGYIVERVTGEQLNVYSRKTIFKPLKMKRTGWFLSEIDLQNHSKLYERKGDAATAIQLYGGTTYPDGGVRTSVSELARFFVALLNDGKYKGGQILRPETIREMQRFQFSAANKPENVDLSRLNSGIFWATKRNTAFVGHAGTDPGVKTEMLSDTKREVGIIQFTNTSLPEDKIRYHFEIFDELYKYGVKLREAKKNASLPFRPAGAAAASLCDVPMPPLEAFDLIFTVLYRQAAPAELLASTVKPDNSRTTSS